LGRVASCVTGIGAGISLGLLIFFGLF
jgi:hypothetical protein